MINQKLINIDACRGLYGKLLVRIYEVRKNIKGISYDSFLPYSHIYEKLGRNFSLRKPEIREVLYLLRDFGFIEISRVGIKLNYVCTNYQIGDKIK